MQNLLKRLFKKDKWIGATTKPILWDYVYVICQNQETGRTLKTIGFVDFGEKWRIPGIDNTFRYIDEKTSVVLWSPMIYPKHESDY